MTYRIILLLIKSTNDKDGVLANDLLSFGELATILGKKT